MIDPDHERLSIRRQCELVSISRASFYRQPAGESPENLELMRVIDGAFMETPWYGSRQMARHLRRQGWCVGRKRVRRLMRKIGLSPIYQAPRTSEPHPQHRIYPYLLRNLAIERPDQVWCADVTYIPMRRGFLYLVAIMDWFSRKVLAWRLSNTMDADFCVAALEEAIAVLIHDSILHYSATHASRNLVITRSTGGDGLGVWSATARLASRDPVCATVGNGEYQHLSGFVVHHERDDSFPPGRDGPKSGGDLIADASLVRRVPQGRDGFLDLGQLPRCDIRPGIAEDPSHDCVEVTRDERVETDSVGHAPRAASIEARAAAKAPSSSMKASRGVSMRARISCARAWRATFRSSSSCIICSNAAATAALCVANTPCPTFSDRN